MKIKKNNNIRLSGLFIILMGMALTTGCTLASPFDRLAAYAGEPTAIAEVPRTPRPTFTPTLAATPTFTHTPTPTVTPIPTDTPTPIPPTDTPTPLPTDTATVAPTSPPPPAPPPTDTPGPTDTPAPSWQFQLAELYSQPTQANILSIIVAIQTHQSDFVPGFRVVGVDPNGVVTKSEISANVSTGYTPPGDVIKTGNTKFEPVSNYVTGTWFFHLETADGTQVTEKVPVTMDVENKLWYFLRFQPT